MAESAEGTLVGLYGECHRRGGGCPLAVGGGCGDIVIACFGAGVALRSSIEPEPTALPLFGPLGNQLLTFGIRDRATERHGGRASEGGAIGWRSNRYRWGLIVANGDRNALAARRPIAIRSQSAVIV